MGTDTSGSNSVVECNLAKVDVEGSNPFSRSIFLSKFTQENQVDRQRCQVLDSASVFRVKFQEMFCRTGVDKGGFLSLDWVALVGKYHSKSLCAVNLLIRVFYYVLFR